jgi:hypothetical protein
MADIAKFLADEHLALETPELDVDELRRISFAAAEVAIAIVSAPSIYDEPIIGGSPDAMPSPAASIYKRIRVAHSDGRLQAMDDDALPRALLGRSERDVYDRILFGFKLAAHSRYVRMEV